LGPPNLQPELGRWGAPVCFPFSRQAERPHRGARHKTLTTLNLCSALYVSLCNRSARRKKAEHISKKFNLSNLPTGVLLPSRNLPIENPRPAFCKSKIASFTGCLLRHAGDNAEFVDPEGPMVPKRPAEPKRSVGGRAECPP